jgi:hypothetical protein
METPRVQCTRSNSDGVGTTPVGEVECWPSDDGSVDPFRTL